MWLDELQRSKVKNGLMQLKPNIARPHPCSRLQKVCDCTEYVRDQLSNAGKRIEIGGVGCQWFNVPMLKPKQEGGSFRWGLDRLWLSCLDRCSRYGVWV